MRSIRYLILLVLGTGLYLGGCTGVAQVPSGANFGAGFGGEAVNAVRLHNTLMCGADLTQSDAVWIETPAALAQRYRNMQSMATTEPPVVDFKQYGVLLISMGVQPTAGYRLNFLPSAHRVVLRGRTLQVGLAWEEPPADSIQAQVLTHPCLLLQVPRQSFNRVEVFDQSGTIRLARRMSFIPGF